ncbi:MAG: hypothetical protein L6Q35_10005, partial [Phycisphaerales bacterium]|nr:hypothetical protein [Phycisphaerales bacterium]
MRYNTVRVLFAVCASALYSSAHGDVVLITSPKTVGPTDTTITATAGGSPVPLASAEIIVRGTTLTMNGRHTIQSLTLERSGSNVEAVLTHTAGMSFDYSGTGTDVVIGLNLTTTGDVFIQGQESTLKASRIDLQSCGYSSATGPGGGISSGYPSGGGHGGAGHNGAVGTLGGDCYGTLLEPDQFGSGGGNDTVGNTALGGRGGGALRLTVGGTLTIDGTISANGENYTSWEAAGGAGGSAWITCGTLAGSGSITAAGGSGNTSWSGGGGGGRVALYHTSGSFGGTFNLSGGAGYGGTGGAGTFYIEQAGSLGTLYIDNADKTNAEGTEFTGAAVYDTNLVIRNQGLLSHKHQDAGVAITFNGDAAIEPDGFINLNARGYPNASGPGAGISSGYPSGGGHGGKGGKGAGGATGGTTYGDAVTPLEFGSGGGNDTVGNTALGGRGGGALRLTVGGTLTIDGTIS